MSATLGPTGARMAPCRLPPEMTIDTNTIYRVTIGTDRGDIVMDLDPRLAPKTVNNFVSLARAGLLRQPHLPPGRARLRDPGWLPRGLGPGRPRLQVRGRARAGRVPARHGGHGQRRARHQRLAVLHLPERPAQRAGQAVQPVRPGHQRHGRGAGRAAGRRLPLASPSRRSPRPEAAACPNRSTWSRTVRLAARRAVASGSPATASGGRPARPRVRPRVHVTLGGPGVGGRRAGLGAGRRERPWPRRRACSGSTTTPSDFRPPAPVAGVRAGGATPGCASVAPARSSRRCCRPSSPRRCPAADAARSWRRAGRRLRRARPWPGRSGAAARSRPAGPSWPTTICTASGSSASAPSPCWPPAASRRRLERLADRGRRAAHGRSLPAPRHRAVDGHDRGSRRVRRSRHRGRRRLRPARHGGLEPGRRTHAPTTAGCSSCSTPNDPTGRGRCSSSSARPDPATPRPAACGRRPMVSL